MNQITAKVIQSKKETWIMAMGACLCCLVVLYIYFLSISVVHVVVRKEISHTIKREQSDIATLESAYMTAQHRLSNSVANLDGYAKASEKVYIDRSDSLVLNHTGAIR